MAAPVYGEDLTDIDLAESGSTGLAVNVSGGGGAAPAFGADLGMQGLGAWDRQVSSHERGIVFNITAAAAISPGNHIFQWLFVATPGITDIFDLRGGYVLAGTSNTDLVQFHVEGSDTYGAAGRVGKCYPVRYDNTSNIGSPHTGGYRTLYGAPGATPDHFGAGMTTLVAAKGSNLGVDAVRYGTGAYITAGEPGNPCTFTGFNVQNDDINNRWGILTSVGGGFELQGTFGIGQLGTGSPLHQPAYTYFEDSDVAITIVETLHAESTFSGFKIDGVGSPKTVCNWTNINITSLKNDGANGIINPGFIEVTTNDPFFTIIGGAFTDIGTTTLQLSSTATGTTWRGTDSITLNGATLTECTLDKSVTLGSPQPGTVITDDLGDLVGNDFTSTGLGHAVELTSIGAGSMSWDNTFDTTTYATVDGSTGDETIYVNVSAGSLTINVAVGATTPTIRTAGATVTIVAGAVTTLVHAQTSAGVDIENARVHLRATDITGGSPYVGPLAFNESVTISWVGSPAVGTVVHTGHAFGVNDKFFIIGADQSAYNGTHTITAIVAGTSYDFVDNFLGDPTTPATGTITSTGVIIDGLTDVNGDISDSRVLASNQPVEGNVRKSTSAPYYKPGNIISEIDSGLGLTSTVTLILDQ